MTDEYIYYYNQKTTNLFKNKTKEELPDLIQKTFPFQKVEFEGYFDDSDIKDNSITVVSGQGSQIKITAKDPFCELLKFKNADGSFVQIVYKENGIFILRPVGSSPQGVRTTYYFDDVGFAGKTLDTYRWQDRCLLQNAYAINYVTPDTNRTVYHKNTGILNILCSNLYERSNWGTMQIQGKAINLINWTRIEKTDEKTGTYSDIRDKDSKGQNRYYTDWHLSSPVWIPIDIPNADNWKGFTANIENNKLKLNATEQFSYTTNCLQTTSDFNVEQDVLLLCSHGPGKWQCIRGFDPFNSLGEFSDSYNAGVTISTSTNTPMQIQLGHYMGIENKLEAQLDFSNINWKFLLLSPREDFKNCIHSRDNFNQHIIRGQENLQNYLLSKLILESQSSVLTIDFDNKCYATYKNTQDTAPKYVVVGNGALNPSNGIDSLKFTLLCKIINEPIIKTTQIQKKDFEPQVDDISSNKYHENGESYCLAYAWQPANRWYKSYLKFYSGIRPLKPGYFPYYCPLMQTSHKKRDFNVSDFKGTYWTYDSLETSDFKWNENLGQMETNVSSGGEPYNATLQKTGQGIIGGQLTYLSHNYFYAALHNLEYEQNQQYLKPIICKNFQKDWNIDIWTTKKIEEKEEDKPTWYVFKFDIPSDYNDQKDVIIVEYSGFLNPISWIESQTEFSKSLWVFKYSSTNYDLKNLNIRLVRYKPKF